MPNSLFAHPLDPLGISPDAALILCFDNPQDLSAQAWDTVGRLLALMPVARLVLHLKPEQAARKDARQALRHMARTAFQPQGAALEHCVVCVSDTAENLFAQLVPYAVCALRLNAGQPPVWAGTTGDGTEGLPCLEADMPQALRETLGVENSAPDALACADAMVETVLNIAARSPHGHRLAALLPRVNIQPHGMPSVHPRLLAMDADEDSLIEWNCTPPESSPQTRRVRGLDLRGQVDAFYGQHRSGWSYVTDSLRGLHNPGAPYLETFIERRFSWGAWVGEQLGPILKPWIGIVHVPLEIPAWFGQGNTFGELSKTPAWKLSVPYCKGLFTLSASLMESLRTVAELQDIPMDVLLHPTEFVPSTWSVERYLNNPRRALVQMGTTYRNLHGIHNVPNGPYEKWLGTGGNRAAFDSLYTQEEAALVPLGRYQPGNDAHTHYLGYLDAEAYDTIFTENIIFAEYYAASATNLVLECIARHTPMLVNPLPAIVEYLGEAYPLYCTTYEEAGAKAADTATIVQAHQYLATMDKTRFTREHFAQSLIDSPVYKAALQDY